MTPLLMITPPPINTLWTAQGGIYAGIVRGDGRTIDRRKNRWWSDSHCDAGRVGATATIGNRVRERIDADKIGERRVFHTIPDQPNRTVSGRTTERHGERIAIGIAVVRYDIDDDGSLEWRCRIVIHGVWR